MDIESIAVSKIKSLIAQTDILTAYINEKDTLPSWDGEIIVYKSASKRKSDILGRVPVQVKGKKDSRKTSNKYYYKYNIELADIDNYCKDGGVIYFVVKISDNGQGGLKAIPYYQELLPAYLYKIKQISATKKTTILPLMRLPENKNDLQNIFSDFLEHKNLQSSVKIIGIKSESELHQAGYTKCFFKARISSIADLIDKPNYMYFENAVGAIACGGVFTFDEITTPHENINLVVSDKTFATHAMIDIKRDKVTVGFKENNLTFSFLRNKPNVGLINFEPYGTISNVKQGLEFMIEATKTERFSINNMSFLFNANGTEKQEMIDMLSNDLHMLTKISEMLSLLGVHNDLFLNDSDTINKLYTVAGSLLAQQIIQITNVDHTGLIRIMLNSNGNCLLLRADPRDNAKDAYLAIDTFKSYLPIKVTTQKDGVDIEENMCSYFVLLHETDFYKAVNFNLDIVHKDIIQYLGSDASRQIVNIIIVHYWFKLLKAFDITGEQMFLDKATDLLERIKNMDNINQNLADTLLLNGLQIIKRIRPFTDTELCKLDEILTKSKELQIIVGAYLLKDDMVNAKANFDKLDDNIKEIFKAYPIYKFWKG